MPEAVVEQEVCGLCGVEKRPEATFCYHCGTDLTVPEPISEPAIPIPVGIPVDPSAEPEEMPRSDAGDIEASLKPEQEIPVSVKRSRRVKKMKPRVIEVEWHQPDSIRSSFVILTVILLMICLAIIAVAMYLK